MMTPGRLFVPPSNGTQRPRLEAPLPAARPGSRLPDRKPSGRVGRHGQVVEMPSCRTGTRPALTARMPRLATRVPSLVILTWLAAARSGAAPPGRCGPPVALVMAAARGVRGSGPERRALVAVAAGLVVSVLPRFSGRIGESRALGRDPRATPRRRAVQPQQLPCPPVGNSGNVGFVTPGVRPARAARGRQSPADRCPAPAAPRARGASLLRQVSFVTE